MTDNDTIRLIFAFKIKHLRITNNLSYQQLKNNTGLSTSYLNDIEKGKRYPKVDKINILANAFNVEYDYLVSKKADKRLQPFIDLLDSKFLKIFPLDLFGLDMYKLIDVFSNAPDKMSSFISTMLKVSRNYQMTEEHFYMAALRSYQDMHDNYFEDLEKAVAAFRKENRIKGIMPYTPDFLKAILLTRYGIKTDSEMLSKQKYLSEVRSYFSTKNNTLYINANLKSAQENFLLGRELAFQYLKLEERPYITRIPEINSFEVLLNNFKASYFSVALLMDEKEIVKDFKKLVRYVKWDEKKFLDLLIKYDVTPEMYLQRLTNLLPKHFGINDVFFLRLQASADLQRFEMTKEIHLSQIHAPYANEANEKYCRRWISINILKRLRAIQDESHTTVADAQISAYWQTDKSYLCLSFAKPNNADSKESVSVTIGLLVNEKLRKLIRFLNDDKLKYKEVHTTCERCSMPNCGARVVPPVIIERANKQRKIAEAVKGIDELI